MSSEKILIIEDEEPISELIKLTLESGGFSNIAILATVIAIGVILIMYFMWRF